MSDSFVDKRNQDDETPKARHVVTIGGMEYLEYKGQIVFGMAKSEKDPDGVPLGALPWDPAYCPISGMSTSLSHGNRPSGRLIEMIQHAIATRDSASSEYIWGLIPEADHHLFRRDNNLALFRTFEAVFGLAVAAKNLRLRTYDALVFNRETGIIHFKQTGAGDELEFAEVYPEAFEAVGGPLFGVRAGFHARFVPQIVQRLCRAMQHGHWHHHARDPRS